MTESVETTQVDPRVAFVDVKFTFKTEKYETPVQWKVKKKDPAGNEVLVDEMVKELKRDSFIAKLPVPTVDGLVDIITKASEPDATDSAKKALSYVLDMLGEAVYTGARSQINELIEKNPSTIIGAHSLDYEALSWEALANRPQSERKGAAISEDTWKLFREDYIQTMTSIANMKKEAVEAAADIFVGKFNKIRSRPEILEALTEVLNRYASLTPQKELVQPVLDYLTERSKALLAVDSASIMASLGLEGM